MSENEAPDSGRLAPSMDYLVGRRDEIVTVAARRGASNIRVFGSVARGDATPDSDIDLLVDFAPGRSLLDEAGLAEDLQRLLGYPIDVGSEVHPIVRERVDRQTIPL